MAPSSPSRTWKGSSGIKHRTEKWEVVFGQIRCVNKKIERHCDFNLRYTTVRLTGLSGRSRARSREHRGSLFRHPRFRGDDASKALFRAVVYRGSRLKTRRSSTGSLLGCCCSSRLSRSVAFEPTLSAWGADDIAIVEVVFAIGDAYGCYAYRRWGAVSVGRGEASKRSDA